MAENDSLEKCLFIRIKDCVLSELKRNSGEMKRAKCPSRRTWVWNVYKNDRNIKDSKPETREQDYENGKSALGESSNHSGESERANEKTKKDNSREIVLEREKTNITTESDKSLNQCGSCDKFKHARYYIKMQNPEAPVCCESFKSSETYSPKSETSTSSCRCDGTSSNPDDGHL